LSQLGGQAGVRTPPDAQPRGKANATGSAIPVFAAFRRIR
jgi:hypothetical protein